MKRIIAITLLMSTLIGCCACQPTPERSAIHSKADGIMEQKINEAPVPFEAEDDAAVSETFKGKAGNVEIVVNAKAEIPHEISALPVIEGTIGTITEEKLRSILAVVMNGKTVYDPPQERTKSQIQADIDAVEKLLADDEALEKMSDDPNVVVFMKDGLVQEREMLLREYDAAKKKIKKTKSDLEFKSSLYYMSEDEREDLIADEREHWGNAGDERVKEMENERGDFRGMSYQDNGDIFYLSCGVHDSEKYPHRQIAFTRSRYMSRDCVPVDFRLFPLEGYEVLPCTVSDDDALEMTNEMMQKLKLSDFAPSEITHESYGRQMQYEYISVTYRRAVNSVVTNEVPEGYAKYRPTYNDENITFCVTDNGIMSWSYKNPIEMGKTLNEGISVKSFDEIVSIFRQQARLTYDCIYEFEEDPNVKDPDIAPEEIGNVIAKSSESCTVTFDSIKLRYIRISEKDKDLTYMYVPAYVFSGRQTFYNGENTVTEKDAAIMINAVDGSIVSSEDCY